ncbi:hypothetical protein LCGC14_3120790 [marine sediment metagenome]|uniref:Methyltransferase type 11 domain-containing protein n=1 Tax=marine sediment metagenome TaxID=412755 RepID=A0A0F8YSA3_9ZZZZ
MLEVSGSEDFAGSLRGIEPSAAMVKYANEKAEANGIKLEVAEGYAEKLPYSAASFDTVFCTRVLHHIPKDARARAITEIRRVMKPGGRVVIVDLQKPRSLFKALRAAISIVSILHGAGSSAARTDFDALSADLQQLGFTDISLHSFGNGATGGLVGTLGRMESAPEALSN